MQDNRSRLSGLSSLLVTKTAIIAFFVGSLLANLGGYRLVSLFLMFMFLLFLSSRLWGFSALKGVSVELEGGQKRMFAGQSAEVEYTVTNHKLLPLIWLELLQEPAQNGCLCPDASLERCELTAQEQGTGQSHKTVFRKKLAFIMGYKKVSWKSRYTACRRGVYQVKSVDLRSGDGFGFTQSQRTIEFPSFPVFVVYPKIVPVRTDIFFRNLWNCQPGSKGYFDDLTMIRGSRPYGATDSWKHINWRLAARQPELQVKLFETVLPRSIHFIVDGASFVGLSEDNEEIEETLSVLASLILRLDEAGMQCGLSLPQTALSPAVNLLFPGENGNSTSDILLHLAGYDAATALPLFDSEGILYSKDTLGQVYFITYDGGISKCSALLDGLDYYAVTVLVYKEQELREERSALSGFQTVDLLSLKSEGQK